MPKDEWDAQLALTPEERRKHLLWAKDEADADGWLTIHGLAALALYGQPFGFTREDLRLLKHCEASVGWKHEEEVRNLADRIEALLPPE